MSPDYVVGVWAGNSNNAPIVNIFSTSISFRAMRDIMLAAYAGRPQTPFNRPEGVVEATVCVPSGKKPTSLCGRTTQDLFAKDGLPKEDDDWWQRVRIDIRNGLRAGPSTSSQFVREQVMLVLPADLLKTEEDRKRAQDWAEALGLPLAPTDVSNLTGGTSGGPGGTSAVSITNPGAGSTVTGSVQVLGRAASDAFQSYRLEYGQGIAPTNWIYIGQSTVPVQNGALGVWNTSPLAPGTYTLRLVVTDRERGIIMASVVVNVFGGP